MTCPHCQATTASDGRFCSQCGRPLKATPHALLVVTRNGRVGREFPLDADLLQIGRWDPDGGSFPEIDLSNDDVEAKVSRRHARIVRREGRYYLEDQGSLNGSFVNRGERLPPGTPTLLNDGDEVILGKTFFTFVAPPDGDA